MAIKKTPTLDGSGKIFDKHIPSRLQDAALNATYASAVQVVADGTNQAAAINAALAAGSALTDRPTIRVVGEASAGAPLVVSSGTTLDLTDGSLSLAAASNSAMIRNTSYNTLGARDKDIRIRGGVLDRGSNAGAGGNLHSILIGHADQVTIEDLTYYSAAGKYSMLVQDVQDVLVRNIRYPSRTASDGVHIIGPAKRVTVRDIVGATGDDIVAITAKDYPAYNPSTWPDGGDVSEVLIENVQMTGGKGSVKVLAGPGRIVDNVTIRNVKGDTERYGVTLFSDDTFPETTGGTIGRVLVDDVQVKTSAGFHAVHCNVTVRDLFEVRSVMVNDSITRPVYLGGVAGTTIKEARISGVKHLNPASNSTIQVTGSIVIDHLLVDGLTRIGSTTQGRAIDINGNARVKRLTVRNLNAENCEAVIAVDSTAQLDLLVIEGANIATVQRMFRNNSVRATRVIVRGPSIDSSPMFYLSGTGGCSIDATVINPYSTVPVVLTRSGTQKARIAGDVSMDVGLITAPREGDRIINTNPTNLPLGPARFSGGSWRNDAAGTAWAPPSATLLNDTFTRTGELNGSAPDTGPAGSVWVSPTGKWATNGTDLYPVVADASLAQIDTQYTGKLTLSGTITAATDNATTRQLRFFIAAVDGLNAARVQIALTTGCVLTAGEVVAGTATVTTLPVGAIPSNAAAADYAFSITINGNQLQATVGASSGTHTLSAAALAVIAGGSRIGFTSTDATIRVKDLTVTAG